MNCPYRDCPYKDRPHRPYGGRIERRRMTIPLVVGYFKMNTAKRINQIIGSEGIPVWQRNYYEHIIRNDAEYNKIHVYIESNPANWVMDDGYSSKST